MALNLCAINAGLELHLLDHIAPLASLLSIPLIVTEPEMKELAQHYYPELDTRYWPDLELRFHELARHFNGLIQCGYWSPHLKKLFRDLYNKEMSFIFCPHGQSDKGYKTPLLTPYREQEVALVYGSLLQEMLADLSLFPKKTIPIGNYRHLYYQKHRTRLDHLAREKIFTHLNPSNRTILYAPTWNDADGATTFFTFAQKLFSDLPPHWNMIVKVHPLLSQRDPVLFYKIEALHQQKPNWIVVEQFPPIYPILERTDVYLGDYSSVGYDALAYAMPMFFLPQQNLPARLHSCGLSIRQEKNIVEAIEKNLCKARNYQTIQRALYKRAFDPAGTVGRITLLLEEGAQREL